MKICIETYGCSANQSNSEIMAGILRKVGYELVSEEEADLIIVNTCTVKKPTESKILRKLAQLNNSDKKLLVAGCMPEVQAKEIQEVAPKASLIGINFANSLLKVIKEIEKDSKEIEIDEKVYELPSLPTSRINPNVAIVQLSQGCNFNCSYCVVRTAKGSLCSFSLESIYNNIYNSVINEGCKEIWLTSQDCSAYGTDLKIRLPALLRKIVYIPYQFKIRIGMMNPMSLLPIVDDLLAIYKHHKIYSFAHIPVQSGSNKVLSDMNRRYTIEEYKLLISKFRSAVPNLTLSTDIIVGYPTETDQDFQATLSLIKEIKPDIIHISRYGHRPYTKSSHLQAMPEWKIKQRSIELGKVYHEIALEKNKSWIGWQGPVLVSKEASKGRDFIGRNYAYKPILLKNVKLGENLNVKIVDATRSYLIGSVV